MDGKRTLASLLEAEREVAAENPQHPVTTTMLAPCPISKTDSGVLPALEMRPPCEVRIQIPAGRPGTELALAAGFDQAAYASGGQGQVRFSATLDGAPVFDERLGFAPQVPESQRIWKRGRIACERGGLLVLRTESPLAGEQAPSCGFALLDLEAPLEFRRAPPSREQPNVVVILVDTLRADVLGCYGGARGLSPAIDALAARGTRFARAFASAPWTWPSTASVFTALGAVEHGVTHVSSCYLAESLATVSESFQAAGWTTAALSTSPLIVASRNFDQGFESFESKDWATADQTLGHAAQWVRNHAAWRFYLYVHLTDPHLPYEPPREFRARFAADVPPDYDYGALQALWKSHEAGEPVDWDEVRRLTAHAQRLYEAEVAAADVAIGRFLSVLDDLDLGDETIVVLTSDHGEEFLEHEQLGHGKVFHDESITIPLIFAGPGVPVGRVDAHPAESRLAGPTLLELAGVARAGNLDRPGLLDAPESRHGTPVFFSTELGRLPDGGARLLHGVEWRSRRLTWGPPGGVDGGAAEVLRLYDYAADPGATRDIASEAPAEATELKRAIEDWLRRAERIRPASVSGNAATLSLLEDIGYVDGGDEEQ
jgi:arylsulfatase A-like enzyme